MSIGLVIKLGLLFSFKKFLASTKKIKRIKKDSRFWIGEKI